MKGLYRAQNEPSRVLSGGIAVSYHLMSKAKDPLLAYVKAARKKDALRAKHHKDKASRRAKNKMAKKSRKANR